jgi:hypothetical protein
LSPGENAPHKRKYHIMSFSPLRLLTASPYSRHLFGIGILAVCFVLLVMTGLGVNAAGSSFAARVDYGTGPLPGSVAVGDFNRDGKPDLAVASISGNTVSVLMNNGNGTFAPKVDYATDLTPRSVAVGDFNTDGKPDLVTANSSSSTVSVLMNNGNGTFAPKVDYGSGDGPNCVAVGDFNTDGKPDLVTANLNSGSLPLNNTVSVLINNGDGTFAQKVDYVTGYRPICVAVGDFNTDGRPDLAVLSNNDFAVNVLLNNGDGTFAPKVDYGVGLDPVELAVGDFNTDGKPDLAAVNLKSGNISVLMNNGNGTFAPKVDYDNNPAPYSIAVGDFNLDGKPDLVLAVAGGETLGVFVNNGDGTFAPKVDYATGLTPFSVAVGDFNTDGKPDLATANRGDDTVSVLINTAIVAAGDFATRVDYATGSLPFSVAVGDFNTDGKPDLVAGNENVRTVTVFTNKGNGTFTQGVDFATTSHPTSVEVADFNLDGKPDLVVACAGDNISVVSVYLNNGNGAFAQRVDYPAHNEPREITVGDFNLDGKPDLAVTSLNTPLLSIFINNGDGTLAPRVDYGLGADSGRAVVGDFNLDGKPDLVVPETINNRVGVFINNGDGTFAPRVIYNAGPGAGPIGVGDFNTDGKPDLAIGNFSNATLSVMLNNGNGTFAQRVEYGIGFGPQTVMVGDFNLDGKPDLAVVNRDSNNISVLMNNGNGTFAPKVDYSTGTFPVSGVVADFNLDGRPDLAVGNVSDNTVGVFLNIPPATAQSTLQLDSLSYTVSEAAGHATITVIRTGDISGTATVQYATSDLAGLTNCNVNGGNASARCDYTAVGGTLSFAAGESSKIITIPLINDVFVEGPEVLRVTLSNPTGAVFGTPSTATLTLTDNDTTTGAANPIDDRAFLIRQLYLDFLNREPEPSGLAAWLNRLNTCPQPGETIQNCDEIEVASAFFRSPEFFDRSYFVYNVYEVAFGRQPQYEEYQRDIRLVSGFLTTEELEARKQAFVLEVTQRQEFRNRYGSITDSGAFVDALLQTAGVQIDASTRAVLISELANSQIQRWDVLRRVVNTPQVNLKFFNKAFVVVEYFAFLRRNPDINYLHWIDVLKTTGDYREMIRGFLFSAEYRSRFG